MYRDYLTKIMKVVVTKRLIKNVWDAFKRQIRKKLMKLAAERLSHGLLGYFESRLKYVRGNNPTERDVRRTQLSVTFTATI